MLPSHFIDNDPKTEKRTFLVITIYCIFKTRYKFIVMSSEPGSYLTSGNWISQSLSDHLPFVYSREVLIACLKFRLMGGVLIWGEMLI